MKPVTHGTFFAVDFGQVQTS